MTANVVHLRAAPAKPAAFKFTATSLKNETAALDAAGAKNVTLRDTDLRGLICKKQRRDWVLGLERKVRGRIWRVTIEHYDPGSINVAAVRAEAQRILGEISAGMYVAARAAEARRGDALTLMTVVEAVDLHARVNPELRPATIRSYRFAVEYLTQGRALRMADMTTDHIRVAYARLLSTHSAATANQMLRTVKALWNTWAAEHPEGKEPTRNPVATITGKRRGTMRKSNVRDGSIPPASRRAWFDHVTAEAIRLGPTGTAHNALAFLFLTGLRLTEATGLRWDEIDGDELTISGGRMKSGEPLTRPVTARMCEVLERQAVFHGRAGWVFPARTGGGHMGDLRKKLWPVNATVLGDARAITAHDLRRGFIAAGTLAGVPDVALKMLVGHATPDITEQYARAIRPELGDLASRVEAELLREVR